MAHEIATKLNLTTATSPGNDILAQSLSVRVIPSLSWSPKGIEASGYFCPGLSRFGRFVDLLG